MLNNASKEDRFNTKLLRGWRRSQLKILKEFVSTDELISQVKISGASGMPMNSHAIGGTITPLVRAELIQKAGRDDNGQMMWKLNEEKADRRTLLDELNELAI